MKWSDRSVAKPWDLKSVIQFCRSNGLDEVIITSRTLSKTQIVDAIKMFFRPASLYCYGVGRNVVKGLKPRDFVVGVSPLISDSE